MLGNLAAGISARKTVVFSDDGELATGTVVLVGFVPVPALNTQGFSSKGQLPRGLPSLCQPVLPLLQLYLPRSKYHLELHTSS